MSKNIFKGESDNNTVAELQISLGMFNNRLDQAEEMMRHLKLHNQRKKGKRMKRE